MKKSDWLKCSTADDCLDSKRPLGEEVNLQDLFSACHEELTDQQRKRDQIIAFYLTLSGVLISFAVGSIDGYGIWVFLFLAMLGFMWNSIVLRYRIYKEVYWISCRTISALYTLKREEITKERVQAIFYRTMVKKSRGRIKTDKDGNYVAGKDGRLKWSVSKLVKGDINSAEKLMYSTLVLMSSLCFALFVGAFLSTVLSLSMTVSVISGIVCALVCIVAFDVQYFRSMCHLYSVVVSPDDKAFNIAYEKAWFLHMYVNGLGNFEEQRQQAIERACK